MTINIKNLGDIDIKHHEIKDNWEEMPLQLTEENVSALKEVEPILAENGLTVNDLMVSLLKFMVEEKDKVKEFIEDNLKQPKILGATLLSKEEAKTLLTQQERAYKSLWWLRSPGSCSSSSCIVYGNGLVGSYCNTGSPDYIVRPALKINISNSDIKVGDAFIFGDKKFKVISETLAWMCDDDIGTCPFRKDWKAEDANIYEASDIKEFIETWFKKAKVEKG